MYSHSRQHAELEEVLGPDHVLDVHADAGASRQVFGNSLEVEPIHVRVAARIAVQVQVILEFDGVCALQYASE